MSNLDDHHLELRRKKWDKWRTKNWPRIRRDIPANRQQDHFDALKQAFYAGYAAMYKETE